MAAWEGGGEVETGEGRGRSEGVVAGEDRGVEVKGGMEAGEEEVGGEVGVELEEDQRVGAEGVQPLSGRGRRRM